MLMLITFGASALYCLDFAKRLRGKSCFLWVALALSALLLGRELERGLNVIALEGMHTNASSLQLLLTLPFIIGVVNYVKAVSERDHRLSLE